MRIGTCCRCSREAWINVAILGSLVLGEYCGRCWRELDLPEDDGGRPATRRVKYLEEPNPWGEVAVRDMEDAASALEEVS